MLYIARKNKTCLEEKDEKRLGTVGGKSVKKELEEEGERELGDEQPVSGRGISNRVRMKQSKFRYTPESGSLLHERTQKKETREEWEGFSTCAPKKFGKRSSFDRLFPLSPRLILA